MTKKRIFTVAGTRPEAIKMAPVYLELKKSQTLEPILLATAQHRQMLDQAFAVFGIEPEFDLNLMRPGQDLAGLTSRILESVTAHLLAEKPDAVLVQGDTTTAFTSALAAFYAGIPVGHVEAGLRTYNPLSPWPEEMNRRLISPLSRWNFPPTEASRAHLLSEKISAEQIHVTGNTVVDALLSVRNRVAVLPEAEMLQRTGVPLAFWEKFSAGRWILVTGHRRESFGGGFEDICRAIVEITERFPDVGILYPVHLNPKVQEPVERLLGENSNIALIDPCSYEEFVWLMSKCYFILSDSGGVQEEAPSLGKPALVMRDTTERPEGVDAGTCRLVGTDPDVIVAAAAELLGDSSEYERRAQLQNPYGDGQASRRIREILEADLVDSE